MVLCQDKILRVSAVSCGLTNLEEGNPCSFLEEPKLLDSENGAYRASRHFICENDTKVNLLPVDGACSSPAQPQKIQSIT